MFQMIPGRKYRFTYRNHRGEVAERHVIFQGVDFGRNEWYPDPTWLLRCFDLDKQEARSFAIHQINTIGLSEIGVTELRKVGEVIEQAYPWGYRSEDSEP